MNARFHRTELLLGKQPLKRLSQAHVAVFGLGGVGSYACESLARSGVGKLTLVDFDTIGLTNINRQNIAFSNTIGRYKTDVMQEQIALINPECEVKKICGFYCEENADEFFQDNFDVVIDAIDSLSPKTSLIAECLKRKIQLFSVMGAAGKLDSSQIRTGDISNSSMCPLARRIRKRLRLKGIESGFQVVYSLEPPILPFSPKTIDDDKKEIELKHGRERKIQGSIGYLTGIFGLTAAGLAIRFLTGLNTARDTLKQP